MTDIEKQPKSPSALVSFLINVLIPVCMLSYMSDGDISLMERPSMRHFWDFGPLWSMFLALALPFCFGLYTVWKLKKFELMSVVGIVSVLLTGTVSLFVVQGDGAIDPSTPWLFGIKEGLIPFSLAMAILVSHRSTSPLLRVFIYTPELFDIKRIETVISEKNAETEYKQLLWSSTLILVLALIISSGINCLLALYFITPILLEPIADQHLLYNQAVGKITWWGFVVIGVPMLIALTIIIIRLMRNLTRITQLPQEKLMIK